MKNNQGPPPPPDVWPIQAVFSLWPTQPTPKSPTQPSQERTPAVDGEALFLTERFLRLLDRPALSQI